MSNVDHMVLGLPVSVSSCCYLPMPCLSPPSINSSIKGIILGLNCGSFILAISNMLLSTRSFIYVFLFDFDLVNYSAFAFIINKLLIKSKEGSKRKTTCLFCLFRHTQLKTKSTISAELSKECLRSSSILNRMSSNSSSSTITG